MATGSFRSQQNEGLPDPTIQSLYESPEGILWIGTRLGLATYDGEQFALDRDLGDQELFGYSNIVADSRGRIYIGTSQGISCSRSCVRIARGALSLPDQRTRLRRLRRSLRHGLVRRR